MNKLVLPGGIARRGLLRAALGGAGLIIMAAAPEADGSAVSIDNFTFSPSMLRVKKGAEVTWTNKDDIPHTVVLLTLGTRSKTLDTDQSFTYRFERTGTFDYLCGLHPYMKGKIVVTV